MLSRLKAPWRQAKVCSNCTRTFEPARIVDSRLECKGCNGANAGDGHHTHLNFVLRCRTFHGSIQLEVALEQDHPCIKQRNDRMRQNVNHLDHRPYQAIKRPMFHCSGASARRRFSEDPEHRWPDPLSS